MRHQHPRPGRTGRRAAALTAGLLLTGALGAGPAAAAPPQPPTSDLGRNVTVFDPSMPTAEIQARVDEVYAQQVANEFGTERYALLFRPGTYGTDAEPLQVKVGYYTEVAGLGASPDDVTINGKVEVYNRCRPNADGSPNCIALDNFWRTVSNLHIAVNAAGQDGCRSTANFFAVSQASPMRRVHVTGGTLSLMDYCTDGPQFASGGFMADTVAGDVVNGSQQQWLTRNSSIGSWSNGVWNQVFSGVEGAPSEEGFPTPPYTVLDETPLSREKPWLWVDERGRYQVRVPAAHRGTRGASWEQDLAEGRTLPLSSFYVATPRSAVKDINTALARGSNLLLTPGVYDVDRTIAVKRAGTVVLGLGHATLTAVGGAVPMTVADVPGVVVAGVTLDAGTVESPVLLQVGKEKGNQGRAHRGTDDPTTLSDVFFRVGGPHVGKVDTALEVNSDDVLVDHTWVWRGDHGVEDFSGGFLGDDERWAVNTGRQGAVVNGDDVTATGLFVEHFQRVNTTWNGERGTVVLYQNELPYDPPTQADWTQPDGTLGYPGYRVADSVRTHRLYGGGSYVYNRNDPSIVTENGFEAPTTPGVQLHHLLTVNLGAGTIRHVVEGVGGQVDDTNTGTPQYVADFPVR
ncbi:adenylyl cyclase [Pseudokineococcus marinus]|uniref:Adenylyl cyclase n=1 Tax=Pseudokineococcus marinus TaxID=351215 RepID=A0A849BPI3_9ACTN|nr:adenylyl cyclase [Pseudokineococcus marinus]NNH22742.1 adenylyl cyclase [Pseudokineococcus marinus]